MDRVEASRRQVEKRLAEVRRAMNREVGLVPRTAAWVLPLAAFAVGLALASRARRRRRDAD